MNLRGLFPSLGAGGSLIAAALCALVVLGGVFAFRGESPGIAQAKPKDLALPAGAVRARTASTASPAPARAAARRVGTVAVRRTAPQHHRAVVPTRPRTAPPQTAPAPAPPPGSGGSSAAPEPVATPAGGTVTRVVQRTREAARPAVEAAPAPVQGPANTAADAVEQAAGTVDGLLKP